MMHIGRVLLIQVDFKEFVMLFAPEVLVPAGFNSEHGISNSWGLFMIKYEFNLWKFDLRRSSSVASLKSEPLLAGTKYLIDSCGP
jgi:hypothetical protein